MGIVVDFPVRDVSLGSRDATSLCYRANVVILPVVRIERYDDEPAYMQPTNKSNASRKRRRRAARS